MKRQETVISQGKTHSAGYEGEIFLWTAPIPGWVPSDRSRLPEKRASVHLRVVVICVCGAERVGPLVLRGDDHRQTQENHAWDDKKKRPESQDLVSRKPKVDQHQKAAEGENDHTEKNASWIQLPHRSALLPRV